MPYELYTSASEWESNVLPRGATFEDMLAKIEETMKQGGYFKAYINRKLIVETRPRRQVLTFDEIKRILTEANKK